MAFYSGKAIDPIQRLGGLWVESLGRCLRADEVRLSPTAGRMPVICFLQVGSLTVMMDESALSVVSGDLICYPRGAVGQELPCHPEDDLDLFWIAMDGPLVDAMIQQFEWTVDSQPFHIGRSTQFVRYFEQMMEAMYLQPFGNFIVNGLGLQLLAYLGQLTRGLPDLPFHYRHVPPGEIIAYMWRHLHQPLSLETIAGHFAISISHLRNVFHATTGLPPMHYLVRLRIDRAEGLLLASDLPIREVAESVGIPDISNFYHHFKRLKGCTPNRRRKQMRIQAQTG